MKAGRAARGSPSLSSRSTEPEEKCRALWPEAISRVFWPSSARRRAGGRRAMPPPITMLSNLMVALLAGICGAGIEREGGLAHQVGGRPLAKAEQPLVDPVGKFRFPQGIAPQHRPGA